ncbi:hypothetical protein HY634_00420 [Candidatus Uhrbacteria bacterium]|nr:hypothetical protein [Candidatus Uhrbacteria bacterium]
MLLRRSIRPLVWVVAGTFIIALALRDLQVDRRLDVMARLDRATPYLSTLGPPSRVALSVDRTTVLGEPVYVNLRIPRWFRRVTVELQYENPNNLPLRFGVRTHPTEWAFQFPEPEPHLLALRTNPLSLPLPEARGESVSEVKTLRVPFDLQRAWQVERNVYRFVLSAPGANAEQPIVIYGLRVTAERNPICLGGWCI